MARQVIFGEIRAEPHNQNYSELYQKYDELYISLDNVDGDLQNHKLVRATNTQIGHINYALFSATVGTTWQGTSPPYTQSITVQGIQENDNPFVDVVLTGDYETDMRILEEWCKIYRIATVVNGVVVYAMEPTLLSISDTCCNTVSKTKLARLPEWDNIC